MAAALEEASLAPAHGDVPVGAVVLDDAHGELVARACNERERLGDPTAHAEILALERALEAVGPGGLARCTLVVTLEPCLMCAGACRAAGVAAVVFGAYDERAGACGSRYHVLADPRLGPSVPVLGGTAAEAAGALLVRFFSARRPATRSPRAPGERGAAVD